MHTKETLLRDLGNFGIPPTSTVLIHSSMKAVGAVEGGADTVLDVLMEYFKPGLLILPTHTWDQIGADNPVFDPVNEPSCVGILTNLFRVRPGVIRSWHPTHSVAAYGADAGAYTAGEETTDTPCPRGGCWGRLVDRGAKIVFLGCTLRSNTFIHGVEEWMGVPLRLMEGYEYLKIKTPGGALIPCPQHRHTSPFGNVSANYIKLLDPFLEEGIVYTRPFGDARCFIADAMGMYARTADFLGRNIQLFADDAPIPRDWYQKR